jgi:hypothetical protein
LDAGRHNLVWGAIDVHENAICRPLRSP